MKLLNKYLEYRKSKKEKSEVSYSLPIVIIAMIATLIIKFIDDFPRLMKKPIIYDKVEYKTSSIEE